MAKNINKRLFLILSVVGILILTIFILSKTNVLSNDELIADFRNKIGLDKADADGPTFRAGEKLVFRLDLGLFSIGRSNLTFEGKTELDGKQVYLIKFVTHTSNFKDTEMIYADMESFLPIRIERDITMFTRKIDIAEEYNQKEKTVKILRTESGKTTEQTIKSDKEIDNILCLIYRYRMSKTIEAGDKLEVNLPLKKIELNVTDIKMVKTPRGKFMAYIIESNPKGYNFWFSKSKRRIPLSIDGAITFGNARMVLIDYIP